MEGVYAFVNPFAGPIDSFRRCLALGQNPDWRLLGLSLLSGFVVFVIGPDGSATSALAQSGTYGPIHGPFSMLSIAGLSTSDRRWFRAGPSRPDRWQCPLFRGGSALDGYGRGCGRRRVRPGRAPL